MPVQIYPPLPDPAADVDTLLKTVEALKITVETLLGTVGHNGWANQMFFQRDVPEASKTGDMWTRPAMLAGEVDIVSVWTGGTWQKLNL